jgi:RNA polymerase sigma-70 factor (ECF subfamily)
MVGFGTSPSQDDKSSAEFEELAMPLFDSLYNFARWLVHNQNDAEDLVQETYLKALRSFASFQHGTNFRAWMFRILKNTFLSSCSQLERRMTVAMDSEEDGHELPVDTETPETILMSRSNSEWVQRAIYNLPVHYRETLLLCEVEEMSYQEIAGILSIPTGTVMSRLARARQAVRESLVALPVDRHPRTQRKEPGTTRSLNKRIEWRSWYEQSSKSSCPANGLYRRICPYTPTLDWDTLLTTFRTHSVPDVKAVKQGRV